MFVYENNIFAYSLDKGETFMTLFTASYNIIDHTSDLWKLDNHFVLHHTAGAADSLSVFNEEGEQISSQYLSFGSPSMIYNECGEIFFYDYNTYYRIFNEGLSIEQGIMDDIIPDYNHDDFLSQKWQLLL